MISDHYPPTVLDVPLVEHGYILGIETSCDETAAAVLSRDGVLVSNLVATQYEVHQRFGGVVPELASRKHTEQIEETVQEVMRCAGSQFPDIKGVAVTQGPGLAGALLVGVSFAKALAYAQGIPCIAVNHLEGHLASAWLSQPDLTPPCVILVVSGGHTHLYFVPKFREYHLIGHTLDDAAGEAFDKAARILGLKFPGGPEIEKFSKLKNKSFPKLPRPLIKGSLDFSFSGLKSSLIRYAEEKKWYPKNNNKIDPEDISEVASAFQEAVVDTLLRNTIKAIEKYDVKALILGGGVTANSLLREKAKAESPIPVIVPSPKLCTDNGAMIATAGYFESKGLEKNELHQWAMDAIPNLKLG